MRHRYGNKKLGKPTDQRMALLKSLVRSLVISGRIQTTKTRAKATQPVIDRLIALGKKGDLASRREALKILPQPEIVKEIFSSIAEKNKERNGGFTRIIPLGLRRGDASQMSILEFVE